MVTTEFKYQLDKSSKKFLCPNCGKKRLVRYINNETKDYLPERFGRCDREVECSYYLNPYSEKYGKNERPIKKEVFSHRHNVITSYIPENVLHGTLEDYGINTFIQNLLKNIPFPFEIEDVQKVIELYYLGTISDDYMNGAVTFPYIDLDGNIRAIQAKTFDNSNHTTKTNWLHSILKYKYKDVPKWLADYIKQENKISVPFGTHLLNRFKRSPVFMVEAPKTAIIGTLYFGFPDDNPLWLAVGSLSYLNYKRCKVLEGRDVYLFPDLSKDGSSFDRWKFKAKELQKEIPNSRFKLSDFYEIVGNELERKKGNDIADFLIQKDWRDFRPKKNNCFQSYITTYLHEKENTPSWFVDAKGILQRFETKEIPDVEYLDLLQQNADNSGLTPDDYIRAANGGLDWELEAKDLLMQYRQGGMSYAEYESKQVKICSKYGIDAETFVSFVNDIK